MKLLPFHIRMVNCTKKQGYLGTTSLKLYDGCSTSDRQAEAERILTERTIHSQFKATLGEKKL